MNIRNIVSEMVRKDSIEVCDGVIISKNLKSIVGGVELYNIKVHRPNEIDEDIYFDSIHDLESFIANSDDSFGCCNLCGEFHGGFGYYVDNETGCQYDSLDCITKVFNEKYGKDCWTTMLGEDFFSIHVEVPEDSINFYDNLIKKDGRYWREYDISYVPLRNDNCYEEDDIDFVFDNIEDVG